MQPIIIAVLAFHVLSAVFWAGSTFTLARSGGRGAAQLFRPQMGAAVVAIASGAYLWSLLHSGSFGAAEKVLALGIAAAICAAVVQGLGVGVRLRALARAGAPGGSDSDVAVPHRIAAVLLAVTIIAMATARYV